MKKSTRFVCSSCGSLHPRWQGQCPSCGAWNTLVEESPARRERSAPVDLRDVDAGAGGRQPTGIPAVDVLLGGGLVPGAVILLGGDPGVGKSTLLLQVAGAMEASGRPVLYASGEESLGQLKVRAARLGLLDRSLRALATSQVEDITAHMAGMGLVVVDSVQTLVSARTEGLPGSVNQVRAVATCLTEAAKALAVPVVLVGHVTKDGQLAGPKLLEHMVDTVLSLEGDGERLFRVLRVIKNRFGPANELVVFEMRGEGMRVVDDPSTFFLEERDTTSSGTALVLAMESGRPFVVEVQALATRTFLAFPRRTALGFDTNRLNLLVAVMEKRLRVNLGQMDIYAKVGGGLRMKDPGLDLGVVAAILSSVADRPLPDDAVFWGEVDLNGGIRPASGHEIRMRQAMQLGYRPVHPKIGGKGWANLPELQAYLAKASRRLPRKAE
ncbi:MAG: DNA repair protein RadA [Desulfomicrobiaceae bacterium]|nr:DNA repair protein RadA [Desulfomicrobiaceae bacterium]